VDHASGDGSAASLREAYPQMDVVEIAENRGPCAGLNRVLEALLHKDVDALLILTDDIELAPDALERLATRLEADPGLGMVAPLVAHRELPELVFSAGGDRDPRTWDLDFRNTPTRVSDWEGRPPEGADFLGTAGALLRASAARRAGPVAEQFYYGYEDLDFTLRLVRQGWRLECVPGALAWQDIGDTSGPELFTPHNPYLVVRNRLGVLARNAPKRILARELLRVISWVVRDAIHPRTGSRDDLVPRLRGLFDFCRGRWGPPPAGT
jgi:GT2 family glycosyltransferase